MRLVPSPLFPSRAIESLEQDNDIHTKIAITWLLGSIVSSAAILSTVASPGSAATCFYGSNPKPYWFLLINWCLLIYSLWMRQRRSKNIFGFTVVIWAWFAFWKNVSPKDSQRWSIFDQLNQQLALHLYCQSSFFRFKPARAHVQAQV